MVRMVPSYRRREAYRVSSAQGNFLEILEDEIQCQRFWLEQNLLTVFRVLVKSLR